MEATETSLNPKYSSQRAYYQRNKEKIKEHRNLVGTNRKYFQKYYEQNKEEIQRKNLERYYLKKQSIIQNQQVTTQ